MTSCVSSTFSYIGERLQVFHPHNKTVMLIGSCTGSLSGAWVFTYGQQVINSFLTSQALYTIGASTPGLWQSIATPFVQFSLLLTGRQVYNMIPLYAGIATVIGALTAIALCNLAIWTVQYAKKAMQKNTPEKSPCIA